MQKFLAGLFDRRRVAQAIYSRLTPPGFFKNFMHVEVETSSYCNRKCSYCPNVSYDKLSEAGSFLMDINILSKIFSDLRAMSFSGTFSPHMYGEPLLEPRIISIIKEAYAVGARPKIYTNADYLTADLLDELVRNGLDTLFISKHSSSLSRGAKEALRFLFDQVNEFKGRNVMDVCREINDQPLFINGLTFRIRDYYSDFREHQNFLHNRGGSLDINLSKEAGPIACQYIRYPVIDVQGNVVLCCNDYHGKHILGNVMERSLLDIWHDPSNITLRKRIYHGKLDLKICQECVL